MMSLRYFPKQIGHMLVLGSVCFWICLIFFPSFSYL